MEGPVAVTTVAQLGQLGSNNNNDNYCRRDSTSMVEEPCVYLVELRTSTAFV
jgi:hypothetical protein